MIQWYDDAAAEVDTVLACDPDVAAANGAAAIARYLADGDASRLVVPDGATRVVIRPLTDAELKRAASSAGMAPQLGAILSGDAEEKADDARTAAWVESEAALGREDRLALNAWRDEGLPLRHPGADVGERLGEAAGDAANRAHAAFVDALTPDERASVEAFRAWQSRREENTLRAGWVSWIGHDFTPDELVTRLDSVRPLSVQRAMRAEIVRHIQRVSVLPPLGKAPSGSPSTAATPTSCTHGHAQTAEPEGSDAPGATVAS